MRIFWLFNHPAPYKVGLFSRLGKLCDLTVFYERNKEGGRNKAFYDVMSENYEAIVGKPMKLGSFNNYSREPLRYLKNHEDYDLIILNGWRTMTERKAIQYCKAHHIPYVLYVNGGIVPKKESGLKKAYKTSYIRDASFYMAPDPESKKYLLHYGAKEDRILLYPYGSISQEEVLQKPYDKEGVLKLRKKLNIEGERVFVSSGFFIPRKGFDTLIRLWPKMPASRHLYLIGEGKEKKHLQSLIKELGLTNVHILPYMKHEELFRFYRACDAYLFPSHEDIYGHVVTEALSQGLPVFSTPNVNAAKLLIQDGVNGKLVTFDESFVGYIHNVDMGALKQNAIDSALPYTYEESAKAHLSIFESILGGKE